ncbi:MAG: bifunctional metallophosphatase/5'-nucleotidase [Anaerolineae bacterium]
MLPETLPPPGTLYLVRGAPNPYGAREARLFLLHGDPLAAPVRAVVPCDGVHLPDAVERPVERPFRFRILHVNDLHGCVTRHTEQGELPVLSRVVWRLQTLRARSHPDADTGVLAFLGGDNFGGHLLEERPDEGYRLYSAAGFDAGVPGNHDFDRGVEALAEGLRRGARFPLLMANLLPHPALNGLCYPAAVIVLKGVRIGLVGLTTRGELKAHVDVRLGHPLEALHNLLPALRPLCDVLIVLSHLGYNLATPTATVRDVGDVELAQTLLPGSVHLIVGGHTHQPLNENRLDVNNVVNGVPIVQAGAEGRHVGEVNVTVRGRSVAVTSARLAWTSDLPTEKHFEEAHVRPLLAQLRRQASRILGHVAEQSDLGADAVHNHLAAGESALMNFLTDGLVARCQAAGRTVDFAMLDGHCVHAGLPVGNPLTLEDWRNVMPFVDSVEILEISAGQLQALLQDNAHRVDRPDEPYLARGFLHFSRHVRYKIALGSERAAARATHITVGGVPLDAAPERAFRVACTGCTRRQARVWEQHTAGSHLHLFRVEALPRRPTGLVLRDELAAYIEEHGGVTEASGARRDGRLIIT